MSLVTTMFILPFTVAWRCIYIVYFLARLLLVGGAMFVMAVIEAKGFIAAFKKWRDKDKPTYGSASYATDKLLKAKGYLQPKGALMGVTQKGKRIFTRDERNMMLMAQPGAGKSQHLIADLRAVLERPDDQLPFLIIGDAANELFTTLAPLFRARNYDIAQIDAVEPDQGSKYDIIGGIEVPSSKPEAISPENDRARFVFNRQLQAVCEALVTSEPNSKNPHFVEFARLLLKCVITVNMKYEGNNKSIAELVEMVIDDDAREALLKRCKKYDDKFIQATMRTMQKMQDKQEGFSMLSTSLRKLESWGDEAIRELTHFGEDMHGNYQRGWNFRQMLSRDKPFVLFIRTGYQELGGDLARVIYSNAVNEVSAMWDATNKPLKRELLIYVDEAGLAGHITAFVKAFSRLRKVGVRLRWCFVGLPEFKKLYSEDWETLLGGHDLVVYGGSNDIGLGKLASNLGGQRTVQSRSESESAHGESKGRTEQPGPLVREDDVRGLEDDECFMYIDNLVARGKKPWRRNKKTGKIEYL